MLLQALSLCPRSWKLIFLLEELKIDYKLQNLALNSKNEFPILENHHSDFSYIFTNMSKIALTEEEKKFYGIWSSIIDCKLIPEIIMPIRYERSIKPIVFREHSCLSTLSKKRSELKTKLKEISEYLRNNQWLGPKHFSICDITLSTAIACMDYLGEIAWSDPELESLYTWYLKIKSRSSFKPILEQKCRGIKAHLNFQKIDF